MSAPIMFIERAFVPGAGEVTPNLILIREDDGRYRRATGADLTWLNENAPDWLRAINRPILGRVDGMARVILGIPESENL
jgi:hypothetical protein